jgi:hypothetical protein
MLFWFSSTGAPDAVVKVGARLYCCDMLAPDYG